MKYEKPKMTVVVVDRKDVIRTSAETPGILIPTNPSEPGEDL